MPDNSIRVLSLGVGRKEATFLGWRLEKVKEWGFNYLLKHCLII
jgi:hypothetical protein